MKDILLDETGDLLIKDGDIVVGESTEQHQKHLLLAQKGDFRQHPQIGVGLSDFLNDDALRDLPAAIQKEFENDGMKVKKINVIKKENDKMGLKIDASY